ncbi:macrophage receptor MARCO [Cololabis saira]|uniref:macrophage receptor MARCO n=1 Tax=Cololabis saira TaxID=129043 RepID=UPI002AD391A7|nr:macrophage receptor MARCO [Cololabis saira]
MNSMETSVDAARSHTSNTHCNPLFGMSLGRNERYSFQTDDLKPAKPRRQWCLNLIVVYIILQTALNVFLIYKVFTLERSATSTPAKLDSDGSSMEYQCGEDGQLQRLRADLNLLNSSNKDLESKMSSMNLVAGPPGRTGLPGQPGAPGEKGPKGDAGAAGPPGIRGQQGASGESGTRGPPGDQGEKGETGSPGTPGVKGEPGQSGIPGLKGDNGDIGLQGPPGSVGLSGFNGTEGPPGPPCAKGEKGEQGKDMIIRLVPGKNRGRVEVRYNDIWGTVCDDNFGTPDGQVVCRMLGFKSVISTFTATPGTGKIWLDELGCTGTESDIFHCVSNVVGVNNCNHDEDAGVHCV